MKSKILGKEKEIELPEIFSYEIREDIVKKVYDAMFYKQPYSTYPLAGKQSSKHKQSHARRKFKTLYGKGISRVPRKTLWRRGDQFYWIGTFIPGTKGGRAAHPPKGLRRKRSINKKEKIIAIKSCIAATASKKILEKNYENLPNLSFPVIISSEILNKKTKEILKFFEEKNIQIRKKKKIRAGKGKTRGRKYKNVKKIVLVLGKEEDIRNIKNLNFKIIRTDQLNVKELSLNGKPGKFVIYTEKAIEELKNKFK